MGLGHITRCISLYEAFEERGASPVLIVSGNNEDESILHGKNYEILEWLERRDEIVNLIDGADVVVVDSYRAPFEFYDVLSRIVRVPVYLDDYRRLDYPRGVVVNGAINAEGIEYPRKEGLLYLLGTAYTPLRKAFWGVPGIRIRNNLETIMVTFGGSDTRNMTPRILKLLTEEYPSLVKKVVIGKGFMHSDEIDRICDERTELIYGPDDAMIIKTMQESDIALSAAGQSLYELARIGTPTIAVGIADNQSHNIAGWIKEGFIYFAGWWDDKDTMSNLKTGVVMLKDQDARRRMSKTGRACIDGGGSMRLAAALGVLSEDETYKESNN